MKRRITSIIVDMQYGGGYLVFMHRDERKDTHIVRTYDTPTRASLRRAQRAQLALMERGQTQ